MGLCSCLDPIGDYLRTFRRGSLALLCFFTVIILYLTGPLHYLLHSLCPVILLYPFLFLVSEFIRCTIEDWLSRKRISPEGKAIFITGCDTGFGNRMSRKFADKGFKVFAGCLYPRGIDAKELGEYSSNIEIIGVNVTKDEDLEKASAKIREDLANNNLELWAVIANAGVCEASPIEWLPMKSIEKLLDVNLLGVIRTVKSVLPFIRRAKGRIIITSSLSATHPTPNILPYSLAKAAIRNFAEGLNYELYSFDITSISVEPFYYRTNVVEIDQAAFTAKYNALDEETKADYKSMHSKFTKAKGYVHGVCSENLNDVIDIFEKAVCSTRPKRNYVVADWYLRLMFELSIKLPSVYKEVGVIGAEMLKCLSRLRKSKK